MTKKFDKNTPLYEILKHNPGLIGIFDNYNVHLVPSTVVAMTSSLEKAAIYNALFDVNELLAELNEKADVDFHAHHGDEEEIPELDMDPNLPAFKRNGKHKPEHRRVWE